VIDDKRGTVPQKALTVLPFDGTPLWMLVCFIEAINAIEEAFLSKNWVGKETLSVDSDLNERTILWSIKTGSPWIDPPQAKFEVLPEGVTCQSTQKKRHLVG